MKHSDYIFVNRRAKNTINVEVYSDYKSIHKLEENESPTDSAMFCISIDEAKFLISELKKAIKAKASNKHKSL